MRSKLLFFLFLLILAAPFAISQEPFSIEPTPKDAATAMPAQLQSLLEQPGTRLLTPINGQNTIVVEVWWRKVIPLEKKGSADPDVVYGNLKTGSLIGVLRFPPEATDRFREDFRDQKLRPGFYTMRYAQIPNDKAHKDSNRYRDAVMLSRVSVDTDYEKVLGLDQMLKQSRLASHTRHPAVLSLVPVRTIYKDFPKAVADNSGLCVLQAKVHGVTEDGRDLELPIAIILVTPEVEEGGS